MRPNLSLRQALAAAALLALCVLLPACQAPNALLRRQATEAMADGDLERAEAKARLAVAQDATDWKAQYYMGLIRLKQGRALEAQNYLEQALTLRPTEEETPDILDALAESFYQQKQNAALTAFLRKAIADRHSVRDYLRQAKYLYQTGDVDGSDGAFRKAARFSPPDDAMPYLIMADFYQKIGDEARAARVLRNAYYIVPSDINGERLRRVGVIPGPTAGLPPER